ncbi:beta-ketoacyl synthase N-terminal-like domain-containing protein [Streptomyces coelicoflavus]|uniref:beta-ketoacyl synthase N-terminal-like domain-containing protein n=1 Tax=Streptomyces coelicoflavus TaxID=285562 RepID=UPI000D58CF2F|nr:beta-ketoacyl synthase N-terminal-like domain-containing protein [Streptomyces coelicoflavus]
MRASRAFITGLGVVAPTGVGTTEHWENSLRGASGIAALPEPGGGGHPAPVRTAGQVSGFDADAFVDSRLAVQTDRGTWMALAAARLALDDARLTPDQEFPFDLSVVTAAGSGGNAFGQREIQALWSQGPRKVSAYQSIGWFYAASTGQISIRHQLKGACGVLVSDGAGGIDALAQAHRLIRRRTGAVLVGGTEAPLSPYALVCQSDQYGISRDPDPCTAYRPFGGAGFVPGEGGAMLMVESEERVRRRGLRVYAEIRSTAATHDGWDPAEPPPDGTQFTRAVREALRRADCTPDDIDVVFADGAGTAVGDRQEADMIRAVFGGRPVPVTVPKTMTGRLCSGGASLDLAWAALALTHRVIPPSVNLDPAAEYADLDLVLSPREAPELHTALVVARGTGGFNAAAVLRGPAGAGTDTG